MNDGKPLHEKLKENEAKAAALRDEQFQAAAFQAPRVYNDDELRFLSEQDEQRRQKERRQKAEVEEFADLAEQRRTTGHSESEQTLKLIGKRKKNEDKSLFMTKKRRAETDLASTPDGVAEKRRKPSDEGENEDTCDPNPLAALIGY